MTITYSKDTGTSGEMQIRDTGTHVEFWLNSHNSTTFNHQLPWGMTVNGVTDNGREFDYSAGAGWQRLGNWAVSTSQTVTFRIFDTGTSGFGGPTTFNQFIDRATVPAAPSTPALSSIASTSIFVTFTDGSNGGAAIDSRQIAYGTGTTVTGATIVSSDGSTSITGLTPGTTYYFWARTHNSKGYSAWSSRSSAVTLNVPEATTTPALSSATPTTVTVTWAPNGTGGSPITGYDIGYNTTDTTPSVITAGTSPYIQDGLTPGTTYYFWVRAKNAVGNGPWSASTSVTTIAGARVKVGGVWKIAIAFVNVAGVWKIAIPYEKSGGVWKGTI